MTLAANEVTLAVNQLILPVLNSDQTVDWQSGMCLYCG